MMKFQNFEVLYGAACDIYAAAGENLAVAAAVAKQKKILLALFNASFPASLADAESKPQFDVAQFMNLLIKFPELLSQKGDKLFPLLNNFEDRGIDVPEELKQLAQKLRKREKVMSSEEQKLLAELQKSFPDNVCKLHLLPFAQDKVIEFLSVWPDAAEGKRREFISLMADLCKHKIQLPEALKNQWIGMAMQP